MTVATPVEERTVVIDSWKWPMVKEKVAKLAKVATKLGVDPVVAVVLDRGVREYRDERTGLTSEVETMTLRFDGVTPQLPGGWTFVGALEHLDAGNLVHGDDPEMSGWRDALNECEHCGHSRRRTKTVILRDETGTVVQVGSTCLKDFLGYHGSPERLIAMLDAIREFSDDDEERDGGWRRYDYGEPTDVFLACVCACVRANGWSAKSSGSHWPTATLVSMYVSNYRPTKYETELRAKLEAISVHEEDVEEARKVREWARTIPADASDYLSNVRVALAGDFVLTKHFGIAASAISARRKEEEREEARAVTNGERAASRFVGAVGDRLETTVTVKFVRDFATDYGDKFLVSMTDDEGNRLKTFSSGDFGRYAKVGERVTVRGTVKKHESYQGTEETMLVRVVAINHEGNGK